jgi:hypothetical protein
MLADEPFEVHAQAAHLFKHPHLGLGRRYNAGTASRCHPAKHPPPG